MGYDKTEPSWIINGLETSKFFGKDFFNLPEVFTQKEVLVSTDIIDEEELSKWP